LRIYLLANKAKLGFLNIELVYSQFGFGIML